jgi:hypothetical protein
VLVRIELAPATSFVELVSVLDSTDMSRPKIESAADYARWFASQGGKARRRALTSAERSASAKKAAESRWRATSRDERRAAARRAARARWRKG